MAYFSFLALVNIINILVVCVPESSQPAEQDVMTQIDSLSFPFISFY